MAIDKIKLRHLAKDKDVRLFKEGDMLDALNISVDANSESSGDLVKNVKSTLKGTAATSSDQLPNENCRVVGSVSDDANGKVYFFVWSTAASNHGIYEYTAESNLYRIILKHSSLAFERYGFVNATLVNGEFETDEDPQTIIYFTDNVNPPRKLNVSRALSTDFNVYQAGSIKEFISVIKTPNSFPPTTEFSTDADRTTNNLYGKVFQFATQYVYKDGEESSLSPHSKIAHPKYMTLQGVNSASIDDDNALEDNLVLINTKWSDVPSDMYSHNVEVKKLRVLARTNNQGNWFLVDEFDPHQDLIKADPHSSAALSTVYTSSSGIYRFYNEGLYPSVSFTKTDRVYNDVPHKASSQAIVGNRMMYSSPTSGYPNTEASATFTVSYLPEPTTLSTLGESVSSVQTITHFSSTQTGDGWFNLDAVSLPDTFSANTQVTLTFEYKPSGFKQWGYYSLQPTNTSNFPVEDNPILQINTSQGTYYCGEADDSQNSDYDGSIDCNTLGEDKLNWSTLVASIELSESKTKLEVLTALAAEIKSKTLSYDYNGGSSSVSWKLRDGFGTVGGDAVSATLYAKKFNFDIAFPEVNVVDGTSYSTTGTNNVLQLFPKAGNFFLPTGPLGSENTSNGLLGGPVAPFVSIDTSTLSQNTGFLSGDLESTLLSGGNLTDYSGLYDPKLINGIDVASTTSDIWSPYDWETTQTNGAKSFALTAFPLSTRRTFKAGSVHEFGIVYFDEYGRPGYVNELGSTYVHSFADVAARSNGETSPTVETFNQGPCDISVNMTSAPPTWAKTYQIVYPGMGSFDRFETYTVGGGFSKNQPSSDEAIYLSLNTLKKFQSEKGAIKDYLYTEGDKLRVVSYVTDSAAQTINYPPSEIIYDVLGVEVVVTDDFVDYTADTNGAVSNRLGTFLKIEPSGGSTNTSGDFDGTADNLWKNQAVVEILTPRKTIEDKVYYEIGEAKRIFKDSELSAPANNKHNDDLPVVVKEGDVHYRPMSLLAPGWLAVHGFSANHLDDFAYISRQVESMDVSDYISSRVWSKGRAHVTYEKAATTNFYNRIIYSEEYGDDIGGLTFSSFYPGGSSYKNLPKKYGAINFIGNHNQNVAALQENKLSLIGVERNIVEYADSSSSLTVGKEVLGPHKEASGDFGVGNDASSVFMKDGMIFFVDRSRKKIIFSGGSEMQVISDLDMSSFFETQMNSLASIANGGRIVSGFDPQENMYYVTFEGVGTTGYSLPRKKWISRYSFTPSNYASIDNSMISGFKKSMGDPLINYLFHKHNAGSSRNNFYGNGYPSEVQVVSKISPSEVKVFNALSYEGNSADWTVDDPVLTDLHQESGLISSFKEKEGAYYASMPRVVGGTTIPVNGSSNGGTSQYLLLGRVSSYEVSGTGHIVTLDNRLSRIPMPSGTPLVSFVYQSSETIYGPDELLAFGNAASPTLPAATMSSYDLDANTITISNSSAWPANAFVESGNGKPLYLVLNAEANGDPVRGRWAKIRLTNNAVGPKELYCINTHISKSKTHHVLGQE